LLPKQNQATPINLIPKSINKIFLIDDDQLSRFLMTYHCKKILPNVKIYDFSSGLEAIKQVKKILPDLILLDLHMPLLNSWSFLTKLEALEIPFVMKIYIVTVSIRTFDREQADAHPLVNGFLIKPLKEIDFRRLLQ
jgi:CheY-like chemotaxis protein